MMSILQSIISRFDTTAFFLIIHYTILCIEGEAHGKEICIHILFVVFLLQGERCICFIGNFFGDIQFCFIQCYLSTEGTIFQNSRLGAEYRGESRGIVLL